MKSYRAQTPKVVQEMFPKMVWAFPHPGLPSKSHDHTVYLTFDDGPIPEVTPWVLEVLQKNDAKATFFCIGDNIRKSPELFRRIISEGHSVGNHTFHHWNGWKTGIEKYLGDVLYAEDEIQKNIRDLDASLVENRNLLFRPPYGKLRSKQLKLIRNQGYHIIMWDVLSADFDLDISEEKCLNNVVKNLKPGSIVVFHDSLKAENNLRFVLPKVLEHIKQQGWQCEKI